MMASSLRSMLEVEAAVEEVAALAEMAPDSLLLVLLLRLLIGLVVEVVAMAVVVVAVVVKERRLFSLNLMIAPFNVNITN